MTEILEKEKVEKEKITSEKDTEIELLTAKVLQLSRELEDFKAHHKLVTELATDYVYSCKVLPGKKLVFEWGGENIAKLAGFSINEIHEMERSWFSIMHPDDVDKVISEIDNDDFSTDKRHVEYRIIDNRGNLRWMSDNNSIERDSMGNIIHLVGAVKDITDRKTAEGALMDSEERHRQNLWYVVRLYIFLQNETQSESKNSMGEWCF